MAIKCKSIQGRHSCREFDQGKKVDNDVLSCILTAGSYAPSGKNLQPWRFKLIDDARDITQIAQCLAANRWVLNAPSIVVVLMDKSCCYDPLKDAMSMGACIQNMLIEAEENGVSSCWIGECTNYNDKLLDILMLPQKQYQLCAILAFGYPAAEYSWHPINKKQFQDLMV